MVIGVDKAVTVRLTVSGLRFEILVDPEKALKLKKGENVNIEDTLAYPAIYKDTRSTELVSEKDMQKVFGTIDILKVAGQIIKKGELQLTTEQRRHLIEQKKNQIAEIISKKGINPQTNTPHPPQRILKAMKKAGITINPFVDAELQVSKILKAIKVLLPIKFEKILFQIKIPPQYSNKSYHILKTFGSLQQEKWLNDGSLQVNIEVLGGMQGGLFQKLANLTHGQIESKILRREEI